MCLHTFNSSNELRWQKLNEKQTHSITAYRAELLLCSVRTIPEFSGLSYIRVFLWTGDGHDHCVFLWETTVTNQIQMNTRVADKQCFVISWGWIPCPCSISHVCGAWGWRGVDTRWADRLKSRVWLGHGPTETFRAPHMVLSSVMNSVLTGVSW